VQTRQTAIDQVRVVAQATHYSVEVIYEHTGASFAASDVDPTRTRRGPDVDPTRVVAIDSGWNTLAAGAANQPGLAPRLVTGRPVKALKHW
jgi:hypothetical protein